MALTKQDAAVAAANAVIACIGAIKSLRVSMNDLLTVYTSEGYSTTWGALATAALNANGSLGTADATPNTANPIDTRVNGQTTLTKAVPQAQLVSGIVLLQQLQKFLTNQPVLQANYNQTVDDLAS